MIYTNGYFSVEVAANGFILVKGGECLSMYSAAIYDDFFQLNHFIRRTKAGAFKMIKDYNLIYAGETLVHLPTYIGYVGSMAKAFLTRIAVMVREFYKKLGELPPVLTNDEKKKLIQKLVSEKFDLKGDNLKTLMDGLQIVGYIDTASEVLDFADILGKTGVAAKGILGAASFVGDAIQFAVETLNAFEAGQRLTGIRAVAQCTAAWAFNDRDPKFPEQIRKNMENSEYSLFGLFSGSGEADAHERAWNRACTSTRSNLDTMVKKSGYDADIVKAVFQVYGEGTRLGVVKKLLAELEAKYELTRTQKLILHSPEPSYPEPMVMVRTRR